ncbi:uncharacterized protein LOC144917435 [Branchiostoma floridae x Branchiostoma belcheri]|nr:hypothetical protein Bbelb_339690 [Branchiostoma belcheri]
MSATVSQLDLEILTSPITPIGELIDWMQGLDLLPSSMQCERCPDEDMELKERRDIGDKFTWRCPVCRTTRSIRAGSLFEEFPKVSLPIWLRFVQKWCEDKLITEIQAELEVIGYVGKKTLSAMCRLMRDLCENKLTEVPVIPMGGPTAILEMDESCFRKTPKYGRGMRVPPIWVFGIVRTDVSPAIGYMTVVDRRDAATLLPIIERCVKPNTTIFSDRWAAYRNVGQLQNVAHHFTVNHSQNFVDPNTGAHTQHIEAYWSRKKAKLRRMHGCYGEDTQSYLEELMWRERYCVTSSQGLQNILAYVTEKYPM